MAGHSQFANIKHKKEAQDGKRAKLFTKYTRMVEVAARSGADPDMNPKLRTAISAARKINMPKSRIEQAVAKGSGATGGENYDEVRYECKHNGSGISFIVNALTDNRNRTASEVRSLLTKRGATLLTPGALVYMFDNVGRIQYDKEGRSDDGMPILEKAIEMGALDVFDDEYYVYAYFPITEFDRATEELEKVFGASSSESRLTWKAKEHVDASEEELQKFFTLVEALEDLDDVQGVDSNCPL